MMWRQALFSGILIGLGAAGYLALGGIPGAVIFAFGLISIVLAQTPLYTGKAGVMNNIWQLLVIWFWNVVGCILIGLLVKATGGESLSRAETILEGRLQIGILKSFLRAVGCGMIIDIAVSLYRNTNSILPVMFGVPLFILCGFYHSIADVTYIVAAWKWSPDIIWYYIAIFLGNYVGCNVRRVVNPDLK